MSLRDKKGRFMKGFRCSFKTEFKKDSIPWNKGKTGIYSEETLKRIKEGVSKALKGHVVTEKTKGLISIANKGTIPWIQGLHHSKKTKLKLSKANRGEKNHFWKGGISLLRKRLQMSFKYRQWRSDVFTRDDFTCQGCGVRGGILNAHHIRSYSSIIQQYEITTVEEALNCEELWNINNGITYCEKCHGTNWIEYFKNKMEIE